MTTASTTRVANNNRETFRMVDLLEGRERLGLQFQSKISKVPLTVNPESGSTAAGSSTRN
jgi:hypothetical protein